ncbi:sensor histidine kinase [Urechidicola vernalis]|uniref:Histidine kinase n=1 Tax=Urechidicola vernalis TaxID=3075600 RepID=A0ABU2Y4Z8_9FLAO|nr:histidine kinase [Urechidicola sp. P050]MDT0553235.1 histidine kinase [Urechidicola sp. P050]
MPLTDQYRNLESAKTFKITFRYHAIFWLLYFSLNTIRWAGIHNDFLYSLKTTAIGFPIHMMLAYFNIYYLMPNFVFKRKYLSYIVLLVVSILAVVVLKFNLTYYLISHNVWPEGPEVTNTFTANYALDMSIGEFYVVAVVTSIKITMDWIAEHRRVTNLEKMQLETELLFLRTQVSPHFFFNTLNNIYSLALENSKKTPQVVLKLSELMRYLLYETKSKRNSLQDEIVCIQNYLDLERLRYGEKLEIEMNIKGEIGEKKIAPILLLSFVENAFKHGVSKTIEKVKIKIEFDITQSFLYFSISNPIPDTDDFNKKMNASGGIGLNNVKKRLELGYKEEEFDLAIENKDNNFTVNLKIKV